MPRSAIEQQPVQPAAGSPAAKPPMPADIAAADDILHLAELVPLLRNRLGLEPTLSDAAILSSLETIMRAASQRDRWRAAFSSSLGVHMAERGRDLNTSLNTLIALLPRPRM